MWSACLVMMLAAAPVWEETPAQAAAALKARALGAWVSRDREDGPVTRVSLNCVQYEKEDLLGLRALPLEELDLALGPMTPGEIDLSGFPRLRRITLPAKCLWPGRRCRLGKGVSDVVVTDGRDAASMLMHAEPGPGDTHERHRAAAEKVFERLFSLLDGLSGLRALDVGVMELGEAEVGRLARYAGLRALKLGRLTRSGWLALARLGRLESLRIDSPPTLSSLRAMRGLRSLTIGLECVPRDELVLLAGLSALEELDIVSAGHCGDAALRHLVGLKRLRKLSAIGVGPEGMTIIGRLTGLEEVDLQLRESGIDLGALAGLKRLRSLRLTGGEKMTNAEFVGVGKLHSLERLRAPCIAVSGPNLGVLACLPRLRELILPTRGDYAHLLVHLRGSPVERLTARPDQMTEAGAAALAGLPQLRALDLGYTPLEGEAFRRLGALAGLTELRLSWKRLNLASFRHFAGLGRLRALDLRSTGVTGKEAVALSGLKALRELDLSNNPIDDSGLRAMHGLKDLHVLDLFRTRVTRRGLDDARRALPRASIRPINPEDE